MGIHLRPTAPIAADALLTGDPKRAMDLASALLERPLMSNLSRGLWGYHGRTAAGRELTVQSTGIGAPSAAVVLEELAELGVRRAVRIGTCAALKPGIAPGDAFVVERALAGDGVSSALTPAGATNPDAALSGALRATSGVAGTLVASADVHRDRVDPARREAWLAAGAGICDLSTAALFAVGERSGVALACALIVASAADGSLAGDETIDAHSLDLARAAVKALEPAPQPSSSATPRLP